jgi:hypothetical protein
VATVNGIAHDVPEQNVVAPHCARGSGCRNER